MAIKQLTLDNLKHLDSGKAAAALLLHLQRAALDCEDRPTDRTARKVTLEFSLEPIADERGFLTDVQVQIHAKSAVPPHRSKVYSMGLRRNGMLVFAEDSPDNIHQQTFDQSDETDPE